jgi:hypothetical protein
VNRLKTLELAHSESSHIRHQALFHLNLHTPSKIMAVVTFSFVAPAEVVAAAAVAVFSALAEWVPDLAVLTAVAPPVSYPEMNLPVWSLDDLKLRVSHFQRALSSILPLLARGAAVRPLPAI